MCFDLDSTPPIPVIAGASVSHEDLVLTAGDGNEFAAFLATPEEAATVGVVILPDVRGLYRFYEELALRFAERGYAAVAIDYYARTAGVAKRDTDFDYEPHREQTNDDGVQADMRAAVEHVRDLGVQAVFGVGFCFGAHAAWLAASWGHGLAGSVGFYGSPTRNRGGGSPIDRADRIDVPILALQAGDDGNITADDNAAFERALAEAGVSHEVVTYDGAPHSFFDRKQEAFAEASDDAWRRTLAFIDTLEV